MTATVRPMSSGSAFALRASADMSVAVAGPAGSAARHRCFAVVSSAAMTGFSKGFALVLIETIPLSGGCPRPALNPSAAD
jgi:hypothetical protein